MPTYNPATNRYSALTGVTPPYYDGNGNAINDGFHQYAWDAEGRMHQIDSGASSWTFDALGRWVERADSNGGRVQAVYDISGRLLAQMTVNGQTLRNARLSLVAGAMAQYAYNGTSVNLPPGRVKRVLASGLAGDLTVGVHAATVRNADPAMENQDRQKRLPFSPY